MMARRPSRSATRTPSPTPNLALVDPSSGENVLGYQQSIKLFGRPKGSGESVWEIKRQLGVISTATHMEYVDHAEAVMLGERRAGSKQVRCA